MYLIHLYSVMEQKRDKNMHTYYIQIVYVYTMEGRQETSSAKSSVCMNYSKEEVILHQQTKGNYW